MTLTVASERFAYKPNASKTILKHKTLSSSDFTEGSSSNPIVLL